MSRAQTGIARYMSAMANAEWEVDQEIRLTPIEKPSHSDHLILKQYTVAQLQYLRTKGFLFSEKMEISRQLIAKRQFLIERMTNQNK